MHNPCMEKNVYEIRFSTDTSSICVFDLGSLKHRLDDDADW